MPAPVTKPYLLIAALTAVLSAQALDIKPVIYMGYRSSGGIWRWEPSSVSMIAYGVQGKTSGERWTLESEILGLQFIGINDFPNPLSPEHASYSWVVRSSDPLEEFATDYTMMKLSYDLGSMALSVGKFNRPFGPGLNSIILSDKSPAYPQFGFDWAINDKWQFAYYHGDVHSGLIDSLRTDLDNPLIGSRRIFLKRYIATHRLQWKPVPSISLAFTETVIYGGRDIEFAYLLPFTLFFSAEHFLGDNDNVQMAFDAAWKPRKKLKLYAVWFIDEWTVTRTFKDPNRNWFAWQGGLEAASLLVQNDRLIVEGAWTDYRVYRHRFRINTFENRGYPIGHWMGAHAQSLQLVYVLPVGNINLIANYIYLKRGELTAQMLADQYRLPPFGDAEQVPRFEGETETRHQLSLSALAPIWKDLSLQAEMEFIQWDHPDFDPARPVSTTTVGIIFKTSFNLAIYYNFDLPGYAITFLDR